MLGLIRREEVKYLELFQQNRIELNYATNGQSLSNLMNTY